MALAAISQSAVSRHLPREAAELSRFARQAALGARLCDEDAGLRAGDLARIGAALRSELEGILALQSTDEVEERAVKHLAADVAGWLRQRGIGLETALEPLRLQLQTEQKEDEEASPEHLGEGSLYSSWLDLAMPGLSGDLKEQLQEISEEFGEMEPREIQRVLAALSKLTAHGQAALDIVLRARSAAAAPTVALGDTGEDSVPASMRDSRFRPKQEQEICWYDPEMTVAAFHLEDAERQCSPGSLSEPRMEYLAEASPEELDILTPRGRGRRGGLTTPSKRERPSHGEATYYGRGQERAPERWHWPMQDAELPGRGGGARPLKKGETFPDGHGVHILRYSAARPRPAGTPPSIPSSMEAEGSLFVASSACALRQSFCEMDFRTLRQDLSWRYSWLLGIQQVQEHLDSVKKDFAVVDALRNLTKIRITDSSLRDEKDALADRMLTMGLLMNKGQLPEWMMMTCLPVMPPDLRTARTTQGPHGTADGLTQHYKRIVAVRDDLMEAFERRTPDYVLRLRKRYLQLAVSNLIDNGKEGLPFTRGTTSVECVSARMKGKQGRMRQNMLGKRVDYSARSVIVVGPTLRFDECGVPYSVARELFKPFLVAELRKLHEFRERDEEFGTTEYFVDIRQADDILMQFDRLDRGQRWTILQQAMESRHGPRRVLLNRAPTLHRLGIQALIPRLTEGQAIKIPPMICSPFNADFDGDTMAVHLVLCEEAQREAEMLMAPSRNLSSPATGDPVFGPTQDMVLGTHYVTSGLGGTPASARRCETVQDIFSVVEACSAGELAHSTEVTATWDALSEASPGAAEDDEMLSESGPGEEITTTAGQLMMFMLVHESHIPEKRNDSVLLASLDDVPLAPE